MSVTFSLIRYVLWPGQSSCPTLRSSDLGSRFTPLGAETKLKVNAFAGRSASLAMFVTVSVLSSGTVRFVGTVSRWAQFTSEIKSGKLLVSLDLVTPLSVTFTVIRLVLGL